MRGNKPVLYCGLKMCMQRASVVPLDIAAQAWHIHSHALAMLDFHDMQSVLQESGTWVHWQQEESREACNQHTSIPQHVLSLLLKQPVEQLQAGATEA